MKKYLFPLIKGKFIYLLAALFVLYILYDIGLFTNTKAVTVTEFKQAMETRDKLYQAERKAHEVTRDSLALLYRAHEQLYNQHKESSKKINRQYEALYKELNDVDGVLPERPTF